MKSKIRQDFELIEGATERLKEALGYAAYNSNEASMQMALAALKNGADYNEVLKCYKDKNSPSISKVLAKKVMVHYAMIVQGQDPKGVKNIKVRGDTISAEIELNGQVVTEWSISMYEGYPSFENLCVTARAGAIAMIMAPHAWCRELEESVRILIDKMDLNKLDEASKVLGEIERKSQRMLSGRSNSSERYIRLLREKPSRDLRSEFESVNDLPKMRRFAVDRAVIALKGGADTSILFRKLKSGTENEKSFAMDVIKSYFPVIAGCDERGQSSVRIEGETLELKLSVGVELKVGALDSTGTAGVYSISLYNVEQLFRFSQIKAIIQSDAYVIAYEKRQEICDKADELIKDYGDSGKTNETLQNCKELKVALAGCQEHALDPLIKIVDSIINAIEGAIQKTLGRYTEALDRKEQKGSGRNF